MSFEANVFVLFLYGIELLMGFETESFCVKELEGGDNFGLEL